MVEKLSTFEIIYQMDNLVRRDLVVQDYCSQWRKIAIAQLLIERLVR